MNINVIDSVFLACLIAVAAATSVSLAVAYVVGAVATLLLSGTALFTQSGWGSGSLVVVWGMYVAGMWFVLIALSRMNRHFLYERQGVMATLQRLRLLRQHYGEHLSWLIAQVRWLQEGQTNQLLVTDMLRSMSHTFAFSDIFQLFARTIYKTVRFESCHLAFAVIGNGRTRIEQRSVYPETSQELGDDFKGVILARVPVCIPDTSLFVADQSGNRIVVYLPQIDNVQPVLIFDQMDKSLFEEIQPLIHPFYLEMRKSYLFEQVKTLSLKDGLTGCYLRRYVVQCINDEIYRSKRSGDLFSLIIFDIDRFKHINDSFGHLYGDYILREIGLIIRKTLRKNDVPARYGGEEFVLLLPATDRSGAMHMAERLNESIKAHPFVLSGTVLTVTVSMGVASYPDDGQTVDELIDQADARMYRVKRSTR